MVDLYPDLIHKYLESMKPYPMALLTDYVDLEAEVSYQVQSTFLRVLKQRMQINSFTPEVIHVPDACTDGKACAKHWTEAYSAYTRLLTNTNKYLSSMAVLEKIRKDPMGRMTMECKAATIDGKMESFFQKEDAIWREGQQSIYQILLTKSPVTERRSFFTPEQYD